MIANFFKIAWRNITRHKKHAAINIASLALGTACCLFIFLWVQDEKGMDNFHANEKNLFTMYETVTTNGKVDGQYASPVAFDSNKRSFAMEGINRAVPEIKDICFYATGYELPWGHPETIRVGEKMLKMNGARASADFFKMFSYPLIQGSAETAVSDIKSIAVSRKMADIFFGGPAKAIGQTLRYENKFDFKVTAVFEDITPRSTLQFDFLLSWEAQKNILEWSSGNFETYVQMIPGADIHSAETNIDNYLRARVPKINGVSVRTGLQPLGQKYLHNVFVNGKPEAGRIEYVRIFSGVALFILVMACINFMNLSTARSVKRAKEVGLRKVVGSSRGALILRFMGESLLFTLAAMLVSVMFVFALLPAFNYFTGKQINFPVLQVDFWLFLAGLMMVTGIVAGSYPALFMSSLQPVRVLKGGLSFSPGAVFFRKGLTVLQFVLSIFLIIATIVVVRQTNFIENAHLGYDRENLVYIRVEGRLSDGNNYSLFKQQLSTMPGIALVDRSSETPHNMDFTVYDPVKWEGEEKNASLPFKPASVGYDFIKLMHLQVVEGRDFSRQNATDSTDAFIVNEEAVRQMGMKNPLGKWISAWSKKGHIIGVIKDYSTNSLRDPIAPVLIDVKEGLDFGVIMVRTQPGQTKQALASMERVYKTINPDYPFAYQFVDEEYQHMYDSEQTISKLSILFAILAVLIGCLGLLGLVVFAAEQRIKEIGVRKILGASLHQIMGLLSKQFVQLVGIAFLIASPLAWYAMYTWLQGFAYKIAIAWWMFALAGAVSVLITLLTISYQAVKAATANPTKSLRVE